jgi:hypothetical protein
MKSISFHGGFLSVICRHRWVYLTRRSKEDFEVQGRSYSPLVCRVEMNGILYHNPIHLEQDLRSIDLKATKGVICATTALANRQLLHKKESGSSDAHGGRFMLSDL